MVTQGIVQVVTVGIVALAFFVLVGFVIWRLSTTSPRWMIRGMFALTGVVAGLPAVLYAVWGLTS
jgi:hypothetical protein